MTIIRGGQTDSGLDRALENALRLGLDETLLTGEIWKGERDTYPDPIGLYDPKARLWQRPLAEKREPPASAEPLIGVVRRVLVRSSRPASGDPTQRQPDQDVKATGTAPDQGGSPRPTKGALWTDGDREEDARRHLSSSLGELIAKADRAPTDDERQATKFRFRD